MSNVLALSSPTWGVDSFDDYAEQGACLIPSTATPHAATCQRYADHDGDHVATIPGGTLAWTGSAYYVILH